MADYKGKGVGAGFEVGKPDSESQREKVALRKTVWIAFLLQMYHAFLSWGYCFSGKWTHI